MSRYNRHRQFAPARRHLTCDQGLAPFCSKTGWRQTFAMFKGSKSNKGMQGGLSGAWIFQLRGDRGRDGNLVTTC